MPQILVNPEVRHAPIDLLARWNIAHYLKNDISRGTSATAKKVLFSKLFIGQGNMSCNGLVTSFCFQTPPVRVAALSATDRRQVVWWDGWPGWMG